MERLQPLTLVSMGAMNKYDYYLEIRLDGKYYCSIYKHGIPGPIAFTDDYDTEEEATEADREEPPWWSKGGALASDHA